MSARTAALSDRERYTATERGITERLQRKARADLAEATKRAQREQDHVVDAARWRDTEDLKHVAECFGYTGLADWFSRGAPGSDYPTWRAEQYRAADADTDRERRADPVELSTRFTDIEIEQGRLDPSVRQTAIEYSALCMAGRHVEAAVYLKQLRQRRQPGAVLVCQIHARHLHHARRSTHRTVRARRAAVRRATADSGGSSDGDPEPPEPHARGPPLSRVG